MNGCGKAKPSFIVCSNCKSQYSFEASFIHQSLLSVPVKPSELLPTPFDAIKLRNNFPYHPRPTTPAAIKLLTIMQPFCRWCERHNYKKFCAMAIINFIAAPSEDHCERLGRESVAGECRAPSFRVKNSFSKRVSTRSLIGPGTIKK